MHDQALSEIIKEHLDNEGISARELGRRCGFSNAYVSVLMSGKHPKTGEPLSPKIDTIQKLADGMGVDIDSIVSRLKPTASILPDKEVLTVSDIAPIFGVNPQSIRSQAQKDARQLGFPVTVIGNKVFIPKAGFLNWYYNIHLIHLEKGKSS